MPATRVDITLPQSAEKNVAPGSAAEGPALHRGGHVAAVSDQVVVSATNFLTNLIVLWNTTQQEFGVYVLAVALLHFLKGLQEQFVASPYSILAQRMDGDDRLHYTGSCLVHQLVSTGVLIAAVALTAAILRFAFAPPQLSLLVVLLLIVVPCFVTREYARRLSFAHFHFRTAAWMDSLIAVTQLAGLWLLAFADKLTLPSVFLWLAVANALGIGFWAWRREIDYQVRISQIRPDWRANWQFGRWAVWTFILGSCVPFFIPWLVAGLRDATVAGQYGACQTLVGVSNMLILGMGNFLNPVSARAFADRGTDGLRRALAKGSMYFIASIAAFAAILLVAGEPLANLLFDNKYPGLGWPLFLLASAQLLAALGVVAGNGLWAINQPRQNIPADFTLMVVTLSAALLVIPRFGVLGATTAVLIGSLAAGVVRWLVLSVRLRAVDTGSERSA
jgi:O-antigen/teichoic acid export membrane protein